jgi:hypothetical protein
VPPRFRGEPAHNIDQLAVGDTRRIAEFFKRVRIGEIAEPDQRWKRSDQIGPVTGPAVGRTAL